MISVWLKLNKFYENQGVPITGQVFSGGGNILRFALSVANLQLIMKRTNTQTCVSFRVLIVEKCKQSNFNNQKLDCWTNNKILSLK